MLYSELRKQACVENRDHRTNDEIDFILQRSSSYFRCRNILARIMQLKRRNKSMLELQNEAENKIFEEFQQQADYYVKNFRGNGFYTIKNSDRILIVKGRDTAVGSTEFKLVPPKTLLYRVLAESFHRKYHDFGSPVYIRAQILEAGYYMPQIIKKLKMLQDKCPLCRRRIQKKLFTAMGAVSMDRLSYSAPFKSIQADLIGPLAIKEFVNTRGTRKVWILTCICHFSRYITLTVVESLSKTSILDSLKQHFLRYGQSQMIETDFGSNFSAAKGDLEDEEKLDKKDVQEISESLKSEGVKLVQRTPKAPWIQGGIERANLVIKKILPGKRMTLFQLLAVCEYITYTINRRPIGISSSLENVKPADVIPVWSKIDPKTTMMGCTKAIESAQEEFKKKWEELYKISILKQRKWLQSNHDLEAGDLVLILDLKTKLGYPRNGRITNVEKDTSGVKRYYTVEYKNGKKFSVVTRPAQSLVIVMKKNEQDEDKVIDSISFLEESDLIVHEKKKKIAVQSMNAESEIVDI